MKFFEQKYSRYILGAILFVGVFLRLLFITSAPKGALIDELHFGYIANSIVQTGRDEHGVFLPIVFKGFGDYKLPGYGYALVPFVGVLGLNNFVIRIPSLLAGAGLILAMYALVKQLGLKEKTALWTSFFIAVSPWPFFLSRFGFESNLALIFFVFGSIALLKSTELFSHSPKKLTEKETRAAKTWSVIAAVCWAATWYIYVPYRPITALIALGFYGYLVWQKLLHWKHSLIFFVALGFSVLLLFLPGVSQSNTARFKQVGILSDKSIAAEVNENRSFCALRLPRLACDVVWNKYTMIPGILLQRFFHTYSPQYLATQGEVGHDFLTVKNYGQFFMMLYPFFAVGMIYVFANASALGLPLPAKVLLILGILVSPVPTLLVGDPQKIRMSAALPFIFVVIGAGVQVVQQFFTQQKWEKLFVSAMMVAMTGSSIYFFIHYFALHTIKHSDSYQSYVQELFTYLKEFDPTHDIYIKPYFSDPLMFYAYYNNMHPEKYQQLAVLGPLEESGFQHTIELGHMKIKDDRLEAIACLAKNQTRPVLFVTDVLASDVEPMKTLRSENGVDIYAVVYDATKYGAEHPEKCQE